MRIMLVGFGVVGSSIAEVFVNQKEKLLRSYGLNPKVVAVVNSKGALIDTKGIDLSKVLAMRKEPAGLGALTDLWRENATAVELLDEIDCDVMIEAAPTNLRTGEPGLSHIRTAMRNGVHVVTTNKGPLAVAMPALLELADHNRVMLRFSGTVGGGTPMLDFAKRCLDGVEILSVMGILNGTTNYILSKMDSEGSPLEDALREAQSLGYAEADPSYDIDGLDAAGKLVILANWVMRRNLSIHDIGIEGLRELKPERIDRAKSDGKVVKLIAQCDSAAKVSLMEIPRGHPLNVSGTTNAITFSTDLAGEITLVGKGAGGIETASAALRDLISIRRLYTRQAGSGEPTIRRSWAGA